MRKVFPAGLVLLSCVLACPKASLAAVFNVSNEAELQQALNDAAASAEDDTINVAAGTYLTSNNGAAPFTYLVNSLDPAAGALAIVGQGSDQTFLDGGDSTQIMDLQDYASTGTLVVQDMAFQNGSSDMTITSGLGVNLGSSSAMDLIVRNCVFKDSSVSNGDAGGAVLSNYNGSMTFENNLLTGNNSDFFDGSGGVLFLLNSDDSLTVTNNIIYNNSTNGFGGGMGVVADDNSLVTLTNNTIVGNRATLNGKSGGVGGGLFVGAQHMATVNLYNNIVFGNTATGDPANADIFSQSEADATINLFNNDFNTFNELVGSILNQGNNLHVDPQLVDPANGNFQLAATSPMIDRGDAAAPSLPSTDFDGNPRPAVAGTEPDIGALEFQPSPSPTPTPVPPLPDLQGSGCSMGASSAANPVFGLAIAVLAAAAFALRKIAKSR